MADPLTLTFLGTVAASEGIKFLYGQASELLRVWRERKQAEKNLEVPFVNAGVLDAVPANASVDSAVVAAEREKLVRYVGALHPYATNLEEVDASNDALAIAAGELRALLEAAYGQRLTFAGEQRERTGTRVDVRQVLGSVTGRVVGVEGDLVGGAISVSQSADEVGPDGSITGYKGRVGQ